MKKVPRVPNYTLIDVQCPYCNGINNRRVDLNNIKIPARAMTCCNPDCKKDFVSKVTIEIKTTSHKVED